MYDSIGWPGLKHVYLDDYEIMWFKALDIDINPISQDLKYQIDWNTRYEEKVRGYLNWQGISNRASHLCGNKIFTDLSKKSDDYLHLFDCIRDIMTDFSLRLIRNFCFRISEETM